ncbi:EAL domain-containing protein [Sporosarcina sp. FSL K6-1522]|uniref:putative bifunctional diguanylate cyclase/phosphodiesterase n=1 Tax=Sporosarcina sp. FSL K6-1522 TaxID=2921554 RepID=UPI00315AD39F
MGNIDVEDYFKNNVEPYIFDHPFNMSILIGKDKNGDFDVLYANKLAISYFRQESKATATKFFGDLWVPVRKKIQKLRIQRNYKTSVLLKADLFNLDLQRRTEESGREFIFIELRNQLNTLVNRDVSSELKREYRSVIENNLDPIMSIDEHYQVTYANAAVHTAFGHCGKILSGSSILDLLKREEIEAFKVFLSRALAGESVEREGLSFVHESGYYLPVYLKAIPVLAEDQVQEIHLIIRDTSIHQKNNEKLLYLSYHDQLTGIWNRHAMKEHFKKDSEYLRGREENLSFIHLDLDRFKLINESLGQDGADDILKKIAERLRVICPETARLYRNGGDEFVITLQNASATVTERVAQTILAEFQKPFYYNRLEYFISVSIGIAVYPEDGKTLEELLRRSEQALAFVKERGRSHYRFYQEEMNSSFPDEALMESHLRRAIELEELSIHYQPQVDLKTGMISSFEALLRWNNRKFGFVSPGQFIPIAEESGLIHEIGNWVLDQVCKQLKEWQEKRFRPVRVAVNISPKQFRKETFVDRVKAKIEHYGICPSSLEVEITESALTDMTETLGILNELKKIGVFISVDDFGTGYSSLSYLKQYPIDIIKIDRSFIQDIESDAKNEAIAKTIINLAHNLGMEVVAEGVEKDLQAQILLEANCQKAQGFLYSRAVPVEELVEKYLACEL